MNVCGLEIPDKPLSNFDLITYSKELKIPNFRGVYMRDNLPSHPYKNECGIVNFNTSNQSGSHWVAYYKKNKHRIYFDSYGQVILDEVKRYLKTKDEINKPVIQRNTDIVQSNNTKICGHLCLYVLKYLSKNKSF